MKKKRQDGSASAGGNRGIQAGSFRAEVVAVGAGARATQVRSAGSSERQIRTVLDKIRKMVSAARASAPQREEIAKHVSALEESVGSLPAAPRRAESALARLSGVLDTVDKGASLINKLSGPIKTLCTLVGASFSFFKS
jgi:hypothetical protein